MVGQIKIVILYHRVSSHPFPGVMVWYILYYYFYPSPFLRGWQSGGMFSVVVGRVPTLLYDNNTFDPTPLPT